jgi:hypothetical protein
VDTIAEGTFADLIMVLDEEDEGARRQVRRRLSARCLRSVTLDGSGALTWASDGR